MGRTRNGSFLAAAILVGSLLALTALTGCGLAGSQSSGTASSGASGAATQQQRMSSAVAPEASKDAAAGTAVIGSAGAGADASTIPAAQKMIVRNKTMRLEVKDVTTAITTVRSLAARDGADITSLQVATSTDQPIYRPLAEGEPSGSQSSAALQAFVTIRVPADKYAAFVDEASKLGKVLFQSENTDDVTQQHVDLKARLDNMRAEEARLREFFTQAKNVPEMLQIEQELSRVRGEVESLAAQVAYLERQAAMATVTIELSEPRPIIRPAGVNWGFGDAVTTGVRAFVGTVNGIIVIVLAIAPLLILAALAAWIARLVWVRSKRRRDARAAEAAVGEADPGDQSSGSAVQQQ